MICPQRNCCKTVCNQFLHLMALQNETVFHRAFGFKQAVVLIALCYNTLSCHFILSKWLEIYVKQLLFHVWNIAKPKHCWCDLMRKQINRLLHDFSPAALLFPLEWERLTFDRDSETLISRSRGRGRGKGAKYKYTLPKLICDFSSNPAFIALDVAIKYTSVPFFFWFVYPVPALVS